MKKFASLGIVFLANLVLNHLYSDSRYPLHHGSELIKALPELDKNIKLGDKMKRTMYLLNSSTFEQPNKVKIVFFGQSITRQNHSRRMIESDLRKRFPSAQLEVLNTAIGGYTADKSVKTMIHELIPHQPDLIVFHVYGGEAKGEYEKILKTIQEKTTAEVINITHHLDDYDQSIYQKREEASDLRRNLASKYGYELVDVREQWKSYSKTHDHKVSDFLNDKIHHNKMGGELWGAMQLRHFVVHDVSPIQWQNKVDRIVLKDSDECFLGKVSYNKQDWGITDKGLEALRKGSALKLEFEGTRVDVIARKSGGRANIKVNGQVPSELSTSWSATLPTSTPIDYRPAINQVALSGQPTSETWTVKFDVTKEDGSEFKYELVGSKSGVQGNGEHSKEFVSNNQVIRLQPESFALKQAVRIKKKKLPSSFNVKWKTYMTGKDVWVNDGASEKNRSGQVTLVQQLPNQKHSLEIIPSSGLLNIEEIIIYKPCMSK